MTIRALSDLRPVTPQRGFTLIEVLVAVAIFVIVGMIAMTGYNEMVSQSNRVEENSKRTRAIQSAVMRMSQDFATLEARAVRDPDGANIDAAVRADERLQRLVELTHSGWSNPAGLPRPTLQRVAYRLDDTRLIRDYWVALDRPLNVDPVSAVLLDKVKSVTIRFMNNSREWQVQWPPAGNRGPDVAFELPIAVEFTIELEDWGKIVRVIEVSG